MLIWDCQMNHKELIDNLVKDGYLKTPAIISAFRKIDRADFVPDDLKHEAYVNAPLPIGFSQTISQPLTVAFMAELLQPKDGDVIFEVGFGSGWQTAILAEIIGKSGKVFAIEIIPDLYRFGKQNLEKTVFLKEERIRLFDGDGSGGLSQFAPFDKIIAAAAAYKEIPHAWKAQLKAGGRLVAPVNSGIDLLVKKGPEDFDINHFPGFAFVPLVSEKEKNMRGWEWDLKRHNEKNL